MASNEAAIEKPVETPAAPATEEKPERPPLTAEEKEKRKAERAEKRKEARKTARAAAKEAKANGEPKPTKAVKEGDAPQGAAPKITVARLPEAITTAELKAMFETYGTILRAEVSKRKGRPTIGTIYFSNHGDVRRAIEALHGKHKCADQEEPVSIQYAKDSKDWGDFLKKTSDSVGEVLSANGFKPTVLRSKDARDFLNRILLSRKKAPANEVLAAGLLVFLGLSTVDDLVKAKLVNSATSVNQLLKDETPKPFNAKQAASAKGPATKKADAKSNSSPAAKVDKTFDAVVPHLDKLEKERWNRMAKANLKLKERNRFRFVDILATPSLELWRWMVEDCDVTPAEAGTCFSILQNYYGYSK